MRSTLLGPDIKHFGNPVPLAGLGSGISPPVDYAWTGPLASPLPLLAHKDSPARHPVGLPATTDIHYLPTDSTPHQVSALPTTNHLQGLIVQAPRPYDPVIGKQPLSFEDFYGGPGRCLDALTTSVNSVTEPLGVPVDRFLGEQRDVGMSLVFAAAMLACYVSLAESSGRRLDDRGSEPLRPRLFWQAVSLFGIPFVFQVLGVDIRLALERHDKLSEISAHDINLFMMMPFFVIVGIMASPWGSVTMLQNSLAGASVMALDASRASVASKFAALTRPFPRLSRFFNDHATRHTRHLPVIKSGDKIQVASDAVTLATDAPTFEFTVDAEALKDTTLARATELGDSRCRVTIPDVHLDKLPTLLKLIRAAARREDTSAIIHVRYDANIENQLVRPGDGTIRRGSVIQVPVTPDNPRGRLTLKANLAPRAFVVVTGGIIAKGAEVIMPNGATKILATDLEVKDQQVTVKRGSVRRGSALLRSGKIEILTADRLITGDVAVIRGSVLKRDTIDLKQASIAAVYKYRDAVYDITFEGPAASLIDTVARGVVERDLSDELLPTALLFRVSRWVSSWKLMKHLPTLRWILRNASLRPPLRLVPTRLRRTLRSLFSPSPINISLTVPDGDRDQFLSVALALATQTRFVSTLSDNPTISLSRVLVDKMANTGKNEITTLRFLTKDYQAKIQSLWQGLHGFILSEETVGKYTYVRVKTNLLFEELNSPRHPALILAKHGRAHIVLDNPLVEAASLTEHQKLERLADKISPGSAQTLHESRLTPNPDPWQMRYWKRPAAEMLATNTVLNILFTAPGRSLRFGRAAGVVALTGAMTVFSAPMASGEMFVMGYEDPSLVATSGARTAVTNGLNILIANGILNQVGAQALTKNKFWMPALVAASAIEMFNKPKESLVTLYDQELQLLGGEDRYDERVKAANRLYQLEMDIERTQPGDSNRQDWVRKAILYKRLANRAPTGFSTERDARLLLEIYNDNQGTIPDFEAEFSTALWLDQSLAQAVINNPEAFDFFSGESLRFTSEFANQQTNNQDLD